MLFPKRSALAISLVLLMSACATTPCPDEVVVADLEEQQVGVDEEVIDPVVLSLTEGTHRVAPGEQISIGWIAEGQNAYVGELRLLPGTEVPPHTHDSEEYLLFLQGGGVMTVDGQEYEVVPGMVVAVPQGVEHSYVNGPELTIAFQVFASSEGAQRYLQWAESDGPVSIQAMENDEEVEE